MNSNTTTAAVTNDAATKSAVKTNSATKVAVIGMLSALAFITVVLIRVPIIPSVGFLKYEAKDNFIVLGGYVFGPLAAITISLIVSFIEMITISTTGYIGFTMNVISTCCFVCPTVILFKKKRTVTSATIGLIIGIILSTAAMLAWNYFLTPIYMNMPREVIADMLIPAFLPFNLIKNTANAALSLLFNMPILFGLKKAHLLEKMQGSNK